MIGRIIPVLCPWDPLRPFFQALIDKTSKLCLQTPIHHLTLPIALGVACCATVGLLQLTILAKSGS